MKLHDHFTSNKWDGLPSFVPYIRFNRGNKFLFYGYIMWTIIQFCDGFTRLSFHVYNAKQRCPGVTYDVMVTYDIMLEYRNIELTWFISTIIQVDGHITLCLYDNFLVVFIILNTDKPIVVGRGIDIIQ